jgi:Na+-transporting methylmalonyl-CoA/oxaloacetate decarboxylase gamma subunit
MDLGWGLALVAVVLAVLGCIISVLGCIVTQNEYREDRRREQEAVTQNANRNHRLVQINVASLRLLTNMCATEVGARNVTVANIRTAIACTIPEHAESAFWFCSFMQLPSHLLNSAGCDLIMEAGVIPVIFHQLRQWPNEANVVTNACVALSSLALTDHTSSAAVKSAMRSVPDCEALLRAARASGLDVHDGREHAAEVLTALDF